MPRRKHYTEAMWGPGGEFMVEYDQNTRKSDRMAQRKKVEEKIRAYQTGSLGGGGSVGDEDFSMLERAAAAMPEWMLNPLGTAGDYLRYGVSPETKQMMEQKIGGDLAGSDDPWLRKRAVSGYLGTQMWGEPMTRLFGEKLRGGVAKSGIGEEYNQALDSGIEAARRLGREGAIGRAMKWLQRNRPGATRHEITSPPDWTGSRG